MRVATLLPFLLLGCVGQVSGLSGPEAAGGGVASTGGTGGGGGTSAAGGGSLGAGGGSAAPDAGSSPPDGGAFVPDGGSQGDAGRVPDAGGGLDGGGYLIPNPLLSVGAPLLASPGTASTVQYAFDGRLDTGDWTGPVPAADGTVNDMWVRVQLGSGTPCVGPSAVLLVWHTLGDPDYTIDNSVNYGTPSDYTIETSADGANWTTAVSVTSPTQTWRSRGHRVDFAGQCYLRLTIQKMHTTISGRHPALAEVSIYDASHGTDDSWVFLGNGPSRFAYDSHFQPDFSADVSRKHPAYSPATLDAADLSGTVDYVLSNLDAWLALNADFKNWVLVLGLEEAGYGETPAQAQFATKMQQVIDKLQSAGHRVIIPRLQDTANPGAYPYLADFNAVIDQLVARNGLMAAPDLYAFFQANPGLLCSSSSNCESNWIGISPSDPMGYAALNQQWADVLDPHYAP